MQSGYPCLSLHGGKDQSDRESTIADFKSDVCNVLIATSVAARGLDVKDLVCRLSAKVHLWTRTSVPYPSDSCKHAPLPDTVTKLC